MVPPEFGPRIGPHSNPVTAGEPAGHCLPAAYGRLPSTAARALHRPAPLFGRGSGVLLPVTACFIGGYSTTFLRLRQGVGGGFFCRCRQGGPSGPAQGGPCDVGSRPVPGGGSRLSREKARTHSVAGGGPPPPLFRARLLSLARFGGCAALFRSMGYYGAHVCTLIWRLSFIKMLFSIFLLENASQIGLRTPEGIAPRPFQR